MNQSMDIGVERLRHLLADRVGYELPQEFHAFLRRQVGHLCKERSYDCAQELADQLAELPDSDPLWTIFISQMTIGESYLYRNPNHIRALREVLLPRLVEKSRHQPVYIWSAGCAKGEEPYTLAILLHEINPEVLRQPIRIFATDIDASALKSAKEARYGNWSFRQTPRHIRRKYFSEQKGTWQLHPQVRKMVEFSHHHIARDGTLPNFPFRGFDLILCRNVLMYLREDYRVKAGRNFAKNLAADGFLIPGQVERIEASVSELSRRFVSGSAIYFNRSETETVLPVLHKLGLPTDAPHPLDSAEMEEVEDEIPLLSTRELESGDHEVDHVRKALTPLTTSGQYDRVQKLVSSGEGNKAKALCQELIEQDPLDARHHCLLSLIHLEEEHPARAVKTLRRAVYCDPDNVTAYYLWWLIGVRFRGTHGERTEWAKRHMLRLILNQPDDRIVTDFGNVSAGDIRYLVRRSWETSDSKH